MQTYVFRLHPHQDLRNSIETWCFNHNLQGAAVVTCVGSLQHATLRMAGASDTITQEGPFEILSLVGTWTPKGGHFHISLSDKEGQVWGGHLCPNSPIYTTAEIVLVDIGAHQPSRQHDPNTGYDEFVVGRPQLDIPR